MIAYKIVTIDAKDGKRYGLFNFLPQTIRVEYLTDGSLITPKVPKSSLYVFPTLNEAVEWRRSDTELWEVECDVINPITGVICPFDYEVIAHWEGKIEVVVNNKKSPIPTDSRLFYGTPALKMVKLIP